MALTDDVTTTLIQGGYRVGKEGDISNQSFCIVRPGGVVGGNAVVEIVYVHVPRQRSDPYEGMQAVAENLYRLLRREMQSVEIVAGPPYGQENATQRATLSVTGVSVYSLGHIND